jgi:hypothetical protein
MVLINTMESFFCLTFSTFYIFYRERKMEDAK